MGEKKELSSNFFKNKSTPELAKELLGKLIVVKRDGQILSGIINETEAYTQDDEASHCYTGKITKRNQTMFQEAGHLYVYSSYGIHKCMNIVTGKKGIGSGVLIRSIIPVEGIKIMKKNRKNKSEKILTNGPGKLCQALGITADFDGLDILDESSPVKLYDISYNVPPIQATPRIGISKAIEKKWRFTF